MATATNPFAGKTTAQMAQEAAGAVKAPTTTGYTAGQMGATGYDAATAGVSGYGAAEQDAVGYDANKAAAAGYQAGTAQGTNWNVDPTKQTVQGQIEGIIAKESPLMQQAQTSALQQMNRRGLLSSSMAIGAGQEAVLKSALPIAQADAATYGAAAKYNADVQNQMAQFNTAAANEAAKFGANAENVMAAANQAAQNEAAKFGATAENVAAAANQAAINEAAKFGASAENAAALANASAQNEAAKFTAASANAASQANIEAQNRAAEFTAGAQNVAARDYATALNTTTQTMLDQSMKIGLANADAATKIELQNIDAQTRKDLADTEARYKNEMQASASANELFQQTTKNIADIMANPDLDAASKQKAVDAQKSYLQGAMAILSTTSKIPGLKDLISF